MAFDPALKRLEDTLRWTFEDKSRLQGFLAKKGRPAQSWLDKMQKLVDYPHTSPRLRSSIFTVMLRLSKNSGLHPKCLSIQNVRKLGDFPLAAGGFGDVWKGVIGDSDQPVCLKIVKVYLDSDLEKLSKEYLREAILWRQLKHPNLLPFLGIYQLEHVQQLCLISPWMVHGNLVQYLRNSEREDVDHYTLAFDIAAGLSYLHLNKIVHGDLKGVNVLITDSLRACIGDFGLSRVSDTHAVRISTSTSRPAGTARWLAPELLLTDGGPSKESDIYSYSCVCFEIFTSLHPFPELPNEMAVAYNVAQGNRPNRPQVSELTDTMWDVMSSCWDKTPSARPSARQLYEEVGGMKERKTFASAEDWNEALFTNVWNNVEHSPPGTETFNTPQEETSRRPFDSPSPVPPQELVASPSSVTGSFPSLSSRPSDSPSTPTTTEQRSTPTPTNTSHFSGKVLTSQPLTAGPTVEDATPQSSATSTPRLPGSKEVHRVWFNDFIRGHGAETNAQKYTEFGNNRLARIIQMTVSLPVAGSEDWDLVSELCARASDEADAKSIVDALVLELMSKSPWIRLRAIRLWAIIFRNSSRTFAIESSRPAFLDILEEMVLNPSKDPMVKERVLDVIAGVAYESGLPQFQTLWKKVKPPGKPDMGIPFDNDDALMTPVTEDGEGSHSQTLSRLIATFTDEPPPPPVIQEADDVIGEAEALGDYTALPTDRDELSFVKGEILVLLDLEGKWWQARKEDGSEGLVSSEDFKILYLKDLQVDVNMPEGSPLRKEIRRLRQEKLDKGKHKAVGDGEDLRVSSFSRPSGARSRLPRSRKLDKAKLKAVDIGEDDNEDSPSDHDSDDGNELGEFYSEEDIRRLLQESRRVAESYSQMVNHKQPYTLLLRFEQKCKDLRALLSLQASWITEEGLSTPSDTRSQEHLLRDLLDTSAELSTVLSRFENYYTTS